MDKYDPNRDLTEQNGTGTGELQSENNSHELTATNFYRELVQFAIFVGVTLFPIYLTFHSMTLEVQHFIAKQVEPVKDYSGNIVSYIVDKDFARAVVVIAFFIVFTTLFFIRHSLKRRGAQNTYDSGNIALIEEGALEAKNDEVNRLKSRIHKDMVILRTIHNQVYDDNKPRLNYASSKGIYYVNANGDLKVHKNIVLKADDKEGPFWSYYATGDNYSLPMETIDELKFSVLAEEKETDLVYLPLEDEPLKKKIAVYFLPLLKPGDTRAFKLYYEWPGNFLKLINTGSIFYDWQNRSYSSDAVGDFYAEWIFEESLGEVACQNTGSKPAGLDLIRADEKSPCRWIFHGKNMPLGNTPLELTFWIAGPRKDAK